MGAEFKKLLGRKYFNNGGSVSTKKIVVHEKALAHLSRGMYRSPASAIRELVSNAWDANAKNVWIDTNYPNFFQLSVRDNGDGFSKEEFERLMSGNIGNSEKRPKGEPLINGRPTIGRLGIGMLGIAQICGAFRITSKPASGTPFCARIHLYDLLKERLDQDDADLIKPLEAAGDNGDELSLKEIDVGEYEYVEFDPTSIEQGTIIVTDDIHPTFTQTFLESLQLDDFKPISRTWADSLEVLSKTHSLQQMGEYWRLVWELSASCPVPYISGEALPERLAIADQKRLADYEFSVSIDGVKLAKPVFLKGNPGGYTCRKISKETKRLYGRDLSFHGYLVVQEGLQLRPDELRGIMIRIKDVGIGYYDPSMLDYRYNEGPRSRWITGEIFVEKGLEDALNIDRDSFNKFHPQYRYIQQIVHRLLHEDLFKEVYKKIDVRSKKRAREKSVKRKAGLERVLGESQNAEVAVKYPSEEKDSVSVEVSPDDGSITVEAPDPENIPTKKAFRELASAIMVIFEVSSRERTSAARRERFETLLVDLLKIW